MESYIPYDTKQKKAEVVIALIDEGLQYKQYYRDKEGHFIIIKMSICWEVYQSLI